MLKNKAIVSAISIAAAVASPLPQIIASAQTSALQTPETSYVFAEEQNEYITQTDIINDTTDLLRSDTVSAPSKVSISRCGKGKTALRLYWEPVRCDGYEIYMVKNGSWSLVGTANGSADNFRIEKLKPSTKYSLRIRAFNKTANGDYAYGKYSDVFKATTKSNETVSAPSKVSISRCGKGKTALRLYWEPVRCDGYEIYMVKNDSWSLVGTANGSADNFRIEKLKPSTKYSFRIRAFNKSASGERVYGDYSSVYKASTKGYIEVKNGVTYVDGILIANKTYSLPASYNPGGLTADTMSAFKKMQRAAANDGISLWIASGFRSYSYQQQLYNNYVYRDGKAAADRYSARPGHSEHQTGLALDVNNPSDSFNGTAAAKWLEKNCSKYGFIIRYPKGKESKTGYKYESWHIRYVGTSLAKKITDSGLCLEEYLGITSVYSY